MEYDYQRTAAQVSVEVGLVRKTDLTDFPIEKARFEACGGLWGVVRWRWERTGGCWKREFNPPSLSSSNFSSAPPKV